MVLNAYQAENGFPWANRLPREHTLNGVYYSVRFQRMVKLECEGCGKERLTSQQSVHEIDNRICHCLGQFKRTGDLNRYILEVDYAKVRRGFLDERVRATRAERDNVRFRLKQIENTLAEVQHRAMIAEGRAKSAREAGTRIAQDKVMKAENARAETLKSQVQEMERELDRTSVNHQTVLDEFNALPTQIERWTFPEALDGLRIDMEFTKL